MNEDLLGGNEEKGATLLSAVPTDSTRYIN